MIRHVVLLRWTADATPDQQLAVVAGLEALPAAIPQIAHYRVGTDLGLADGNASLVVIADFASVADYEVYRDDATHQHIIATLIKPILASRSAAQYAFDPTDA